MAVLRVQIHRSKVNSKQRKKKWLHMTRLFPSSYCNYFVCLPSRISSLNRMLKLDVASSENKEEVYDKL